jgi:long-subunit acyl-CoA synthetase (AMP-forming)
LQPLIAAIAAHALAHPQRPAVRSGRTVIDYAGLHAAALAASAEIDSNDRGAIAIGIENSTAWVISDLAILACAKPCLPLPPFFTPAQQAHALRDAGAGWLLTDRPDFYEALLSEQSISAVRHSDLDLAGDRIARFRLSIEPALLPQGTAKITYTSGTTGTPKGVCLSATLMENVARALAAATRMTPQDRHLCLLPLATLLENIGGVYAPLLSGACVMPTAGRQDSDASAIPGNYGSIIAGMLDTAQATTAIMIPQMLQAVLAAVGSGVPRPQHLRFLAVGGARVSPLLLDRAAQLALPVFEGYGLSECASVVALNTADNRRPGSVGRPLPHVHIDFSEDGEILVRGAGFLGYAGDHARSGAVWPTGDLGHLDADGFLHLTGRKKDIFITAFGRNVSPDWVESELTLQPAIAQAWVHGEARPWNTAVIVPAAGVTAQSVTDAIAAANTNLPGYAQVSRWLPAQEPFTSGNGELTTNGRLRRAVIAKRYTTIIDQLYLEHSCELS